LAPIAEAAGTGADLHVPGKHLKAQQLLTKADQKRSAKELDQTQIELLAMRFPQASGMPPQAVSAHPAKLRRRTSVEQA